MRVFTILKAKWRYKREANLKLTSHYVDSFTMGISIVIPVLRLFVFVCRCLIAQLFFLLVISSLRYFLQ